MWSRLGIALTSPFVPMSEYPELSTAPSRMLMCKRSAGGSLHMPSYFTSYSFIAFSTFALLTSAGLRCRGTAVSRSLKALPALSRKSRSPPVSGDDRMCALGGTAGRGLG